MSYNRIHKLCMQVQWRITHLMPYFLLPFYFRFHQKWDTLYFFADFKELLVPNSKVSSLVEKEMFNHVCKKFLNSSGKDLDEIFMMVSYGHHLRTHEDLWNIFNYVMSHSTVTKALQPVNIAIDLEESPQTSSINMVLNPPIKF